MKQYYQTPMEIQVQRPDLLEQKLKNYTRRWELHKKYTQGMPRQYITVKQFCEEIIYEHKHNHVQ